MTTPPETTPPPSSTPPPRTDREMPVGLGMVPGNAELLVWILALIVAMLVCWIDDELDSGSWLNFFLFTTAAYLISRGVAKASRVYEY